MITVNFAWDRYRRTGAFGGICCLRLKTKKMFKGSAITASPTTNKGIETMTASPVAQHLGGLLGTMKRSRYSSYFKASRGRNDISRRGCLDQGKSKVEVCRTLLQAAQPRRRTSTSAKFYAAAY